MSRFHIQSVLSYWPGSVDRIDYFLKVNKGCDSQNNKINEGQSGQKTFWGYAHRERDVGMHLLHLLDRKRIYKLFDPHKEILEVKNKHFSYHRKWQIKTSEQEQNSECLQKYRLTTSVISQTHCTVRHHHVQHVECLWLQLNSETLCSKYKHHILSVSYHLHFVRISC